MKFIIHTGQFVIPTLTTTRLQYFQGFRLVIPTPSPGCELSRIWVQLSYKHQTTTSTYSLLYVLHRFNLCARHLAATQYVASELHRLENPHYRGLWGLMVTQWSQLRDQSTSRDLALFPGSCAWVDKSLGTRLAGTLVLAFSLSSTSPHTYHQTSLVPSPHTPARNGLVSNVNYKYQWECEFGNYL